MPSSSTFAQQVLWITKFERQTNRRRDRRESDVAFVPVQLDVQLAVIAFEQFTVRRDRAGVRACRRLGQTEARDFIARRPISATNLFFCFSVP